MLRVLPGALASQLWHTQLPGPALMSQQVRGSHDCSGMTCPHPLLKPFPPPGSPLGSGFQGCRSGVGVKEAAGLPGFQRLLAGRVQWEASNPWLGLANRMVPIWLTCQVEPIPKLHTQA